MKEKFKKDLPVYLNGFAVGMLFWKIGIKNIDMFDAVMFCLAGISFKWYGQTKK